MWTLFKREFEDVWMYLIAAILVVGGPIAVTELAAAKHPGIGDEVFLGFLFGYILLCILLLVLAPIVWSLTVQTASPHSLPPSDYPQPGFHRAAFAGCDVCRFILYPSGILVSLEVSTMAFTRRLKMHLHLTDNGSTRCFFCSCFSWPATPGLRMGLYNKRVIYTLERVVWE